MNSGAGRQGTGDKQSRAGQKRGRGNQAWLWSGIRPGAGSQGSVQTGKAGDQAIRQGIIRAQVQVQNTIRIADNQEHANLYLAGS